MQQRISISNGHVIDPANCIDRILDVHIEFGRIVAIGQAPTGFKADLNISAQGQIVCPGLIDIGVRLREPGYEHKATIASEVAAAASAGITTLCCLPDTKPVIDTPAVVELIRQRAGRAGKSRVFSIGAMTKELDGEHLSEMAALQQAGCIAVSNADIPFKDTMMERRALEYASTFDLICVMQPTDHALQGQGCIHEGYVSARLGLPGIPEVAETVALARDLILAEYVGARIHIHCLSTAAGAIMFGRSLHDNQQLTTDVAIHNLYLTETFTDDFDSNCHVIPPLRTEIDREELRHAVLDKRITAICSDHQPHEPDAKTRPFPATASGISGLETLLGLTLRLVQENVLTMSAAIELLTWGPARSMGLALGRLNVGFPADICIFDPTAPWLVDKTRFLSRGQNTPFDGWILKGEVNWTIVDGHVVFQRYAN